MTSQETLDTLTPRQRQVLQLFLEGQSDEAIAATLTVDSSTVRHHLANICKVFGLANLEGERYSHREELRLLFAEDTINHTLVAVGEQADDLEPEFPGGLLEWKSPFYLYRPPIEERCLKEILKPGTLVRIRAPRQMGKTSLLHYLLSQAKVEGLQTVRLNLRQAEPKVLKDLDSFLRWFCANLCQKLGFPLSLDDYWDRDRFGSIASCTVYMQGQILSQLETGLVLGLDDVDWLFEATETAQGFFALLRSWHEEASILELWQKLRLIVVHATEAYIPLNLNQSPFNVGLPMRLPEFTPTQIQTLARQYSLKWSSEEVEHLTRMIGGHPYLVQLALYAIYNGDLTLEELLKTAATQAGIYAGELRYHWQELQKRPTLMEGMRKSIESREGVELEPILAYQLESMGLVRLQGNLTRVSCELYRLYFGDRLFSSS